MAGAGTSNSGPLRGTAEKFVNTLSEMGGTSGAGEVDPGPRTVILADTGPAALRSGGNYLVGARDVLQRSYDEGGTVVIQRITTQPNASGAIVGSYSFVHDPNVNSEDDTGRRDQEFHDAKAALAALYPTGTKCPGDGAGAFNPPAKGSPASRRRAAAATRRPRSTP